MTLLQAAKSQWEWAEEQANDFDGQTYAVQRRIWINLWAEYIATLRMAEAAGKGKQARALADKADNRAMQLREHAVEKRWGGA